MWLVHMWPILLLWLLSVLLLVVLEEPQSWPATPVLICSRCCWIAFWAYGAACAPLICCCALTAPPFALARLPCVPAILICWVCFPYVWPLLPFRCCSSVTRTPSPFAGMRHLTISYATFLVELLSSSSSCRLLNLRITSSFLWI